MGTSCCFWVLTMKTKMFIIGILLVALVGCAQQETWPNVQAEASQRCVDGNMQVVNPSLCQQQESNNLLYHLWLYHWYFGGNGINYGNRAYGGYIARYPQRPTTYSPRLPFPTPTLKPANPFTGRSFTPNTTTGATGRNFSNTTPRTTTSGRSFSSPTRTVTPSRSFSSSGRSFSSGRR